MKASTLRGASAAMLLTIAGLPLCAQAVVIPVPEMGDTRASATNVDGLFNLDADANIFNSSTVPHVSVSGTNDATDDIDWYSFSGIAGATVFFDIDFGWDELTFTVDTTLHLFDGAGTLIAYNDDTDLDPGSSSGLDAFLGEVVLPGTGLYTIAVSNYGSFSNFNGCSFTGSLTRPDGGYGGTSVTGCTAGDDSFNMSGFYDDGDYVLHISKADPTAPVPVPTTLLLFGIGLIGMGRLHNRRRRTG